MMRFLRAALILLLISCVGLAAAEEKTKAPKVKYEDLNPKFQHWLDVVAYIISEEEKDVFMRLTSDRERDIFIEAFWKQRDPTQGTPQNEFMDEHMERFRYANEYYGRGTARDGWKTDQGRYYIILGKPNEIERWESTAGIVPCQAWYYYGDKSLGLPTYFVLVFFRRGGFGEFKLYSPLSDGPQALLEHPEQHGIEMTNFRGWYFKIKELAPTLARVSLSMVPGEIPYNFMPPPRTNFILARIHDAPVKKVKTTYASHFLDYKGFVSTDYLTNFVECSTDISVVQDPVMGLNFVHFSMVPQKISIDYFQPNDQYYCNFTLSVSVRQEEEVIFQFTKDFPFYFSEDRVPNIKSSGLSIEDSFPCLSGHYKIILLIQNSVGREFSVYEEEIFIPESGYARILDPILAYKTESKSPDAHFPYRFRNQKLSVDSKNTYSLNDDLYLFFNITDVTRPLWEGGRVDIALKGVRENNPVEKDITINLKDVIYNPTLDILRALPLKGLVPDYYELDIRLVDEIGKDVDAKKMSFAVSPQVQVNHPISLYKTFPLDNSFLFYYTLAYQYDRIGDLEKAESFFERAYGLNPSYMRGITGYAKFLLKMRKFDRALELVEKVRDVEELRFDYFSVRGKALMGKGMYDEAIIDFVEGNTIYNSDTSLLNSLGFCYHQVGDKEEALRALNASLSLDPEQEDIVELVEKIEKDNR